MYLPLELLFDTSLKWGAGQGEKEKRNHLSVVDPKQPKNYLDWEHHPLPTLKCSTVSLEWGCGKWERKSSGLNAYNAYEEWCSSGSYIE